MSDTQAHPDSPEIEALSREDGKKRSAEAPVVLDTITTRFLMLFIIVLVIPLFSLIIFTGSLLKNHLDQTAVEVLSSRNNFVLAKLDEQQQTYQDILHHFGASPNPDLRNLCARNTRETCFLIDFARQKVIYPETPAVPLTTLLKKAPDFETLGSLSVRENNFYSLWNDQLFMFTAYRPDKNPSRWYVLGVPINDGLLREFYRENPSFRTGLWILQEPFHPINTQWLARGIPDTSHFKNEVQRQILQQLYSQQLESASDMIDTNEHSFRIAQSALYNLHNEKIARIVTILPTIYEQSIITTYYLGIYIIVVASIVFSVIVAILASRSITQPMLKLVDQVVSLSQTGGLSGRVTVKGVHEINALRTAFNTMLDELQQEHQIKDDFVATLTHDLKVPLLAEKQTLNYLGRGMYGEINDNQNEVLEVLQSSNQSNLDLVNGILEIYRYESGQIKLVHESVALDELLMSTVDELTPLAREKKIDLSVDNPIPPERKAVVYVDRLEIKRVITNLISNAITNTPKFGNISCRLLDPTAWGSEYIYKISDLKYSSLTRPCFLKDHIALTVQDSGIGFSTEDLPRLFSQFAANRGRNPMSIGLGLYNCYQVVNEHGGSIWIETTEGEGSAVTILLPTHAKIVHDRRKQVDRRQN